MGKNKLKKFSEMETMEFVLQYPFGVLEREGFPYRGKWHEEFFHNSNPVALELGCGKGEYTDTREMARHNGLQLIADTSDLYGEGHHCATEILGIRTYYEQQWLERGLTIKYISFELPGQQALSEPEVEIEHDTYRSFSRGELQHPELREAAVKPKQ